MFETNNSISLNGNRNLIIDLRRNVQNGLSNNIVCAWGYLTSNCNEYLGHVPYI